MPTLDLEGWKASYLDYGVGLPLVFIPGIEEYKESFDYQLRGLSDRYRVLAYDVREHEDGQAGDLSVLVEDLARLLDRLRLPGAVIAGHSFGSLIAQLFARTYPERTTALILISGCAKAPTQNPHTLLRYLGSGHILEPESGWERLLIRLGLRKPEEPELEEHLAWVSKQAAKTSQATLRDRLTIVRQFDSRPWLERLWMPLLLIVGQHDRPPFLSAAQLLQHLTPDSVVEVVEGAAHFPHIERHDLTNAFIDEFLAARLTSLVD